MTKILVPRYDGIFKIAADAFADLWEKVTGKRLEIITEDAPKEDLIVLGSDAVNAFAHDRILDKTIGDFCFRTGTEEYAIQSATQNGRNLLFLAGARNRALLYAVYHFFEYKKLCFYFWDGDRVVKADDIDITGLDLREKPHFEYRGLRYFAHRSLDRFQAEHWGLEQWKHEIDWIVKKRMNMFMLRIGLDDLFQKAFPDIVSYPQDGKVPESKERSYDDRNLFWPLEYRGELRKQLLAYARERDLMHPEDVGTMTHWYSRTPWQYLDAVKPDFLPQASGAYKDGTGLVWDIRQDKNMEAYFKLTEAHIREYGSPELFHTIGLSERRCYEDKEANHEMKLYTYRRIISKLREKYPLAPLMIASWEFVFYWTPEQVRELLAQFDPSNTILLDYTSDFDSELNNFLNWDVIGKFPWIFGIFHAYESESDMRGNYEAIERRLPMAVADKMCKGLIYWPEISHSDTLMLEYLAANGWNPVPDNIKIKSFIKTFCQKRYGENERYMDAIWEEALPIIQTRHCGGPGTELTKRIVHNIYELSGHHWSTHDATGILRSEYFIQRFGTVLADCQKLLQDVAAVDIASASEFVRRDIIDIARTVAQRATEYQCFRFIKTMDDWRNGVADDAAPLLMLDRVAEFEQLMCDVISASDEFSLNASLKQLNDKHPVYPGFEYTLKGNSENGYCRTQITELLSYVILPELAGIRDFIAARIAANNRLPLSADMREFMPKNRKNVQDLFYAIPLADMKPDKAKALAEFSSTIRSLAQHIAVAVEVPKQ